ncbi:glycosyltransferase family 4 protein [Clostridium sp. E02]|uniref:glycosyltransferase family 4 protein n=1 Tax=Clostridium sp. E02 TaxID=2487134 RepID=UPI000F51E102|nr:glycosyltransferase family 4 protein [Clostridium sp. E02]
MKRKIAIINQRYGLEVNGGSELYTRQIAERLNQYYDVEVLTSCAVDYIIWDNFYPVGIEMVNQVRVRRFNIEHSRNESVFPGLNDAMHNNPNVTTEISDAWIEQLGPFCPTLVQYVKAHEDDYSLFIVVTYLYYPAAKCIPLIGDKVIFIPTAHEEPFIHFKMYQQVFESAKAFVFLTEEEKRLVEGLFVLENQKKEVMGVGVDIPDKLEAEGFNRFEKTNYLIYVGRIDEGKNCPRLFQYFVEYKRRNPGDLKLILMGKKACAIPRHKDIIPMGFVSEDTKFTGILNAKLLILPSLYESLSIAVLEAMKMGVPVLVNGNCDVLKGHCLKSNAGLYYKNYFEFESCINYMLIHQTVVHQMSVNAKDYVEHYFNWDKIMEKFCNLIEETAEV